MPLEPNWRAEAARHGLDLSDDDLAFIRDLVERVQAALASQRQPEAAEVEPPYLFGPPRAPARRPRRAR